MQLHVKLAHQSLVWIARKTFSLQLIQTVWHEKRFEIIEK